MRKSTAATRAITAAVVAALGLSTFEAAPANAACAPTSAAERWSHADVIADARALEGPTPTGVQRFRVMQYLKGRGPAIVRVNTGVARRADGSGVSSGEAVLARRGERWRIFARGSARAVLRASVCDGSRRR